MPIYCLNIMQILSKWFPDIVQILSKQCLYFAKMIYDYCPNIVQILSRYCPSSSRKLFKQNIQIWTLRGGRLVRIRIPCRSGCSFFKKLTIPSQKIVWMASLSLFYMIILIMVSTSHQLEQKNATMRWPQSGNHAMSMLMPKFLLYS